MAINVDTSKDPLFWEKVKENVTTGCWEWQGFKIKGYGQVTRRYNGFCYVYKAHRYSYSLYKGQIADGLLVLHTCDNPKCVRPDHLFLGTQQDNIDDMYSKGRNVNRVGNLSNNVWLNEDKIKIIRALYPYIKQGTLANFYKVHVATISAIINRKIWNCVKPLTEQEVLEIRTQWASQYT